MLWWGNQAHQSLRHAVEDALLSFPGKYISIQTLYKHGSLCMKRQALGIPCRWVGSAAWVPCLYLFWPSPAAINQNRIYDMKNKQDISEKKYSHLFLQIFFSLAPSHSCFNRSHIRRGGSHRPTAISLCLGQATLQFFHRQLQRVFLVF